MPPSALQKMFTKVEAAEPQILCQSAPKRMLNFKNSGGFSDSRKRDGREVGRI